MKTKSKKKKLPEQPDRGTPGIIRPIVYAPNPVLYQVAGLVNNWTDRRVQRIINDLLVTCEKYDGVGIAAPQIGISKQIIIVASKPNASYPKAPLMEPVAMINPRLLKLSNTKVKGWEGCLSVPGFRAQVPRHNWVTVEFIHRDGYPVKATYRGFIARVLQHEIDHLNGILFLSRVKDKEVVTEEEFKRLTAPKAKKSSGSKTRSSKTK